MKSEDLGALLAELIGQFPFPSPAEADAHGLLAYGGDLSAERLLAAYASGIFPWAVWGIANAITGNGPPGR